jgi:hypothetical protein
MLRGVQSPNRIVKQQKSDGPWAVAFLKSDRKFIKDGLQGRWNRLDQCSLSPI